LARAQSEGFEPAKPKPVRRHSSGDHAFLPDQKQKDAINAAKKNFGVPPELVQDREVCVMANDACDAISLSKFSGMVDCACLAWLMVPI
jgi:hypothetical protein